MELTIIKEGKEIKEIMEYNPFLPIVVEELKEKYKTNNFVITSIKY